MSETEPENANSGDFIDWMEAFRLGDEESTTARMVLQLNLYIKEAWTTGARARVVDVAQNFVDRFRDFIKFTYASDLSGEHYKLEPFAPDEITGRPEEFLLERKGEGREVLLFYVDVNSDEDAGEAYFCFISGGRMSEELEGGTGLLQIGLPLRAFEGWEDRISDYYLDICEKLKPVHGSAGYGLTFPVHRGVTHTLAVRGGEYHQVATTFPCMEHNAQDTHTNDFGEETPETGYREWMRTTGWMTVVGDPLLEKIGGRDVVAETLTGEGIEVRPYEGGLAILAGERPLLGYEGHGLIPPAYGTIARLLKPIRCPYTQPSMLFSPTAYTSYEERDLAFKAWRERFDEVGL